MLSEHELKQVVTETNRVDNAIRLVINNYPEEQWIVMAQKALPDVSLLAIRETIMIQCGGDVVVMWW